MKLHSMQVHDHHCECKSETESTIGLTDLSDPSVPYAHSRRSFLQIAGMFAAAGLAGCAAPSLLERHLVIDTHHHFYPPEYEKAWEAWDNRNGAGHYPSQMSWTPRTSNIYSRYSNSSKPSSMFLG